MVNVNLNEFAIQWPSHSLVIVGTLDQKRLNWEEIDGNVARPTKIPYGSQCVIFDYHSTLTAISPRVYSTSAIDRFGGIERIGQLHELMSALIKKNATIAILTRGNEKIVRKELEEVDLDRYFSHIIGRSEIESDHTWFRQGKFAVIDSIVEANKTLLKHFVFVDDAEGQLKPTKEGLVNPNVRRYQCVQYPAITLTTMVPKSGLDGSGICLSEMRDILRIN
jgi:HAD superfamily phosphatase (TIGR01681 family)